MFAYIKLSTLEYPVHEGDIRIEHPEIDPGLTGELFPLLSGYALVEQTPPPEFDGSVEKCEQDAPVELNGTWTCAWKIVPLSEDEKEIRRLKHQQMIAQAAMQTGGETK